MAPRTRSNRVEKVALQQLLASGQPINTHGLPALPDELYLEIASQFPAMPVPTPEIPQGSEAEKYHDRYFTLLSLTQTCQALRRVFLRYLWQRIEVYDGMKAVEGTLGNGGQGHGWRSARRQALGKGYAQELVRQLEVVTIRDPSLAVHVNILNVTVLEYSFESVMEELARCIALFPNLHTIQLHIKAAYKHRSFMFNVFKQYTYPQIRTISVSSWGSPIIDSCPRMVRLYSFTDVPWLGSLDLVLKYSQLEVLGAPLSKNSISKYSLDCLPLYLPNLRDVTLDRLALRLGFDWIKPLMKLRNLHIIRLRMDISSGLYPSTPGASPSERSEWVKWSLDILSRNRNPEAVNKRVIWTDSKGEVKVYRVEEIAQELES
ncbi:unnamed protein product [Cyclocybe aegerita]|uniref:Uncharacterized protein n=1 Tax=Cyclocybe aegerita TaxID=1973307 RepID=A0A8S0XL48_CYCAE|nr:unnamed protein product [Cyclocybe aegerita]